MQTYYFSPKYCGQISTHYCKYRKSLNLCEFVYTPSITKSLRDRHAPFLTSSSSQMSATQRGHGNTTEATAPPKHTGVRGLWESVGVTSLLNPSSRKGMCAAQGLRSEDAGKGEFKRVL